ncbi:unnamed protein product, partial [Effrenium voratum]
RQRPSHGHVRLAWDPPLLKSSCVRSTFAGIVKKRWQKPSKCSQFVLDPFQQSDSLSNAHLRHEYFKPIPKLKKMLTTKDKSLRHVAPDEGRAAPVAKPAKEEQPGAVPEAILPVSEAQLQRRQQLLEVVRKYSSRSASRAREDRLEYHEWGHAKSGAEVLAPDTMRLG